MKKVILVILICLIGQLFNCSIFAQGEEIEIGEIVITATKTEKPVKDVPASVEVMTKDEIKNLNIKTTPDAVKSLLGVTTKGAIGLGELYPGIGLRGMSGDKILILLDGKKIPEYQWPRIPVDSIEKIEVVKGPFSSIYGSEAMGGVVNIITKKPKEGLKFTTKFGYESQDRKIFQNSIYGKSGKLGYCVYLQKRETDGYPNNEKANSIKDVTSTGIPPGGKEVTGGKLTYDKYGKEKWLIGNSGNRYFKDESYDLKLTYDIDKKQDLTFDASYREYNYRYDNAESFLSSKDTNVPYYGTATGEKVYVQNNGKIYEMTVKNSDFLDSFGGNPTYSFSLTYNNKLKDDLKLKSYMNYIKTKSWYNDPAGRITETPRKSYEFEANLSKILQTKKLKHNLIGGLYYENADNKSEKWYLSDWQNKNSKTELDRLQKGKMDKISLFLQDEVKLLDNLTIFGGARYDSWSFSGDITYREKKGDPIKYQEEKKRTKEAFSPKLSAVYQISPQTLIRSSIGKGFKTPRIYDMVQTWTYGNKLYLANSKLSPEENIYYDISCEHRFKNIKLKGAYFNNKIDNLIGTRDFTQDEVQNYNTQHGTNYTAIQIKDNISEAKISGFELEARSKINKDLTAFVNYTTLDSKVTAHKTKPEIVGKKIPYTPEEKWSFGIDYKKDELIATLRGNYTGDCFTTDDNSDIKNGVFGGYDSYTIWDAKISYDFAGTIVSLTVDNIFDKKYYEYYPNPGRLVGLHIERSFDIK